MIYGVPSYRRPQCRTVRTLMEYGVKREDIVIATQNKEDYREYKAKHSCEVIYREGDCAAANRNTLIDYVKQPMILIDDDVTCIKYRGDEGFKKTAEALTIFESIVEEHKDIDLIGNVPTDNNLVRREGLTFACLICGGMVALNNAALRYDERFKMIEDYELSCRVINAGGNTLRANHIALGRPKDGSNEGGMHDRYKNNELQRWIATLSRLYSDFEPNKGYTGGKLNGRV